MQGKFYIAGIVALPVWHEINHEIKTQNLSFFRTSWFKCWNSLPVGSWSQVFIPQRSIIAGDQFELQRKSRGKSDFGEEFLILTLQVALLCFLLAWHSRDPLLKHFTYFNVSGCVCLCVCVLDLENLKGSARSLEDIVYLIKCRVRYLIQSEGVQLCI